MKYLLAVLFLITGVSANGATWKLDRSHSEVTFSVPHLVISEVTGRFTDFEVTKETPGDDLLSATIAANIKTASINTGNEKRDGHLQADDFLSAEKYPVISFQSTSIEKTGPDSYNIHGNLTIRDVTRPVALDTKYRGTVKDPWGNTKVAYKATTSINRFDYGVKWNKTIEAGGFVAGEAIHITLLLQFVKQ